MNNKTKSGMPGNTTGNVPKAAAEAVSAKSTSSACSWFSRACTMVATVVSGWRAMMAQIEYLGTITRHNITTSHIQLEIPTSSLKSFS